jgi:hypothetical protein
MKTPDSYLGNPNLKRTNVPVNFTPEQVEEYVRCSNDPVYFMKKYIMIVTVDSGLKPFAMYPFQEEMVKTIKANRFCIAKMPRQCGKSTCVISDICHEALFKPNQNIAILANKQSIAKLHMDRLKTAYEYLPKWLQQGVKEWNKYSIEFENGSKIIAAATSPSAIRGGSFNYILLDEFAHIPNNIAEEFYSSVYPTISSGKTTKLVIISTPNGLNMYYKLWTEAVEKRSDFVYVDVHWSDVPGRDENWRDQQVKNTSEDQFRKEHECEFIGSTNSLIAAAKLKTLTFITPEFTNAEGLKVYRKPITVIEKPENSHLYVMTVDTSRGVGLDYHAFAVMDISQMPYQVVATFRNNTLSPLIFPNVINAVGKQYNDAFILIELNDIGAQVSDILHNDFEYENLLVSSIRGRKGQTLDGGFGKADNQRGVRTTAAVKKLGCSVFKSMVETDKLVLNDYDIIRELVSFVSNSKGYAADTNHNDDLVMCLVLFGWLSTQNYFKDLTNMDIRKSLFDEKMKHLDDETLPLGFFDDGSLQSSGIETDEEGNTWSKVDL